MKSAIDSSAETTLDLPMFTPTTTGADRRRRRRLASRAATAAAPSLLNPMRLTIARSSTSRNSRGRGFPGCRRAVTVPTSTNENPSAANASMPTAFLSNPAASPTGPGNVSPNASINPVDVGAGANRRVAHVCTPGTRAATRIPRNAAR